VSMTSYLAVSGSFDVDTATPSTFCTNNDPGTPHVVVAQHTP
jgi:hypothetical protein